MDTNCVVRTNKIEKENGAQNLHCVNNKNVTKKKSNMLLQRSKEGLRCHGGSEFKFVNETLKFITQMRENIIDT